MNYLGYIGKVLKCAFGTLTSIIITLLFVVCLLINITPLFSQEASLEIGTGLATVGITTVAKEMNNSSKLVELRNEVGKITKRIARRTTTQAARSLASIYGQVIPFYGIFVILGDTAWQLGESCQTMEDLNEINDLIENETGLDEVEEVCGLKVPSMEEVIEYIKNSPGKVWEGLKQIKEITGLGNYIKQMFF